MNEKDYYEILGVSSDATVDEIRKTFQQKARKLHPDINKAPDAEEKFKELSEAYAVLSDESKRKRYDAMRSGNPFAASGNWNPSTPGDMDFNGWPFGGGWGSPFGASPFGGVGHTGSRSRARAYNPKVGADVVYHMDFDADAAKKGTRRGVTYNHFVSCEVCSGKGSVHTGHAQTCPTCNGSGHINVDLMSILGFGEIKMVCPECEGTGKVVVDPCDHCGGSGRVLTASEIIVDIPANSHDGDVIRLAGKGNAGTNGSSAGDFVLRVGVPSERLDQLQAFGFRLVGLTLPFFAYGAIAKTLLAFSFTFSIPLFIGLYLVFSRGIVGRRGIWWKNALRYLGDGLANGLVITLFLVGMVSCISGGRL
ncbi:DnaJ domain-containing protein [Atopobium fossor]|uniref:DnaJ domain-containing protein n=1 Tax=Atopobium fossor TaxID=39487 RepID=UPI0012EBD6D5|nr:DnaJ domain-containing protein [Atopobium fossor]